MESGFEGFSEMMKQGLEQTRKTMERYVDLLQKNIKASPMLDPELSKKMKGYTENNIAAVTQFAQQVTQAKDFQDFWRIQNEFMQAQWKTFNEQMEDLGEIVRKGASGLLK